jgi:hypothetical protein
MNSSVAGNDPLKIYKKLNKHKKKKLIWTLPHRWNPLG